MQMLRPGQFEVLLELILLCASGCEINVNLSILLEVRRLGGQEVATHVCLLRLHPSTDNLEYKGTPWNARVENRSL